MVKYGNSIFFIQLDFWRVNKAFTIGRGPQGPWGRMHLHTHPGTHMRMHA